jgi:hypothetical protein
MRTDEDIKMIVEGAFKPLRCVAEVWDYQFKLRFKVFDENKKGIIQVPDLSLRGLREESQLRDVVLQARRAVMEKGFDLDPWELQ